MDHAAGHLRGNPGIAPGLSSPPVGALGLAQTSRRLPEIRDAVMGPSTLRVRMLQAAFPLLSILLDPTIHTEARETPQGLVRLDRNVFTDSRGPFLGLGATYMQALRHCKFDRPRLEANLAFLSERGFNFVRVLGMVAWPGLEIAPVDFENFDGKPVEAWPDYWRQFEDLLDLVHAHGMRTEITVFADAQRVMPTREARLKHIDTLLARITGREGKIQFIEVANEAWQNGFPGQEGIAELRDIGKRLSERTEVLVALSSPSDLHDRGAELDALYRGSGTDLATLHFSRDIRSVIGPWLPVIDCWSYRGLLNVPLLSNEPIGPGSSVNSEEDPAKLIAAAAHAYMAGLPGYVFHTGAGVRAEVPFADMPGVNEFSKLLSLLPPDLPQWEGNRGLEGSAPLTVQEGQEATPEGDMHQSGDRGALRNFGATRGPEFVAMPIGIRAKGVDMVARHPLSVRVANPLTGELYWRGRLAEGETLHLPQGAGTWFLKGSFFTPSP